MAHEPLYTEPFLVLDPGRHIAMINRVDSDREGRFLVTASDDKTVRIWAATDGRHLRTFRLPAGHGRIGMAYAAATSPDGLLAWIIHEAEVSRLQPFASQGSSRFSCIKPSASMCSSGNQRLSAA